MREAQLNDHTSDARRLPSTSTRLAATIDERLRQARPRLLRIARSFALPADVAEDIAQETSLRAWWGLADLRDPTHFDAWLNTICRNQCRMYVRAQRRAPAALSLPTGEDIETDQAAYARGDVADALTVDPLDAVSASDAALLLERAFAYLSPRDRAALELRYIQGLPLVEAAEALGSAPHALEATLNRARAHLRATLAGPLRHVASDFGLNIPRGDGWSATRIGCYLCGRRKLQGRFEVAANGRAELRLRCPACSTPDGADVFRSKGIAPFDGLRAFRPALTRSLRALAEHTQRTLASGYDVCLHCGHPTSRRVATAEEFPADLRPARAQRWVVAPCLRPGCPGLGAYTALDAVIGAEPAAQQFIADHPRWMAPPDAAMEWQGRAVVRFQLRDVASAAQLTLLADQRSLSTLATY